VGRLSGTFEKERTSGQKPTGEVKLTVKENPLRKANPVGQAGKTFQTPREGPGGLCN